MNSSTRCLCTYLRYDYFSSVPYLVWKDSFNLQRREDGWREVLVSLKSTSSATFPSKISSSPISLSGSTLDGVPSLCFSLAPESTPAAKLLAASSPRYNSRPVGSRLEVSPAAFKLARQVAEVISPKGGSGAGGSALVVDYGGDYSFGSSLRVCHSTATLLSWC